MIWLAWVVLGLAVLPIVLAAVNLPFYRRPALTVPEGLQVSILIPARNEETNIEGAVRSALASRDAEVEVVVLDDHSTDRTAAIVKGIAATDPRLRLEQAEPLPKGWSGKMRACHQLTRTARHRTLLFQDADVQLAPDSAARLAAALAASDAALISGFPRQRTDTLSEALIVPLMKFLILGYLPLIGMRVTRYAMFGAGCGQLFVIDRAALAASGGHSAIRATRHDGLKLPRLMRRAGYRTDLVDATQLAVCRMYSGGFREVWNGFAKNATEGMATPVALPVWTVLLFGGHVLPWLLLGWALLAGSPDGTGLIAGAALAGPAFRLFLAMKFRQDPVGALLHPVGVTVLLAIQFWALVLELRARPAEWRGRSYRPDGG